MPSSFKIQKEQVLTELDPDLQRIILLRRQGGELPPHLIETVTEDDNVFTAVDVIAKLKYAGQTVPGLWVIQEIGPFVTALVDIDRIAEVREQVDSLKAARAVRTAIGNSVPEIQGSPAQISNATGRPAVDGSNVIVGFVDHGCDFAHSHFRRLAEGNGTRLLYLWDQREGFQADSPDDFGYGREFDRAAINGALEAAAEGRDPYETLGYDLRNGHGTAVMDIAVGNGGGINPQGVAPGADIIFVESIFGDLEPDESVGNSRDLVDAVQYIFNRAQELNRPAVVNISLSTDAGPHDGSTPVEQAFDYMLQTPGRAIVMAAGNSATSGKHVRRRIEAGGTQIIRWQNPPFDRSSNKIELWYDGDRVLELSLRSVDGEVLGPFPLGTTHTIQKTVEGEDVVAGRVFHRPNDSGNGDNNIVIVFEPVMGFGIWSLELQSLDSPEDPAFDVDAWIERDSGPPSIFPDHESSDQTCTIGTLACGRSTIVVGGYKSAAPHYIIGASGTGPTRDGKLKPEVSAPGKEITAAVFRTNSVGSAGTGTSLSAPHLAGTVALLMQTAGTFLTTEETRALVIDAARGLPPDPAGEWSPRFGHGRANAAASVAATRLPPPPGIVLVEHEDVAAVEVAGAGVAGETVLKPAPSFPSFPYPPPNAGGGPGDNSSPVPSRRTRTFTIRQRR